MVYFILFFGSIWTRSCSIFKKMPKFKFFSCDPLLHHVWILQTQLLRGKDNTTYILS